MPPTGAGRRPGRGWPLRPIYLRAPRTQVIHLVGDGTRDRTGEGTLVVSVQLANEYGAGWEFAHRIREAQGVLSVRPALVPEPTAVPIPTLARTYTDVTVDSVGRPTLNLDEETRDEWGHLAVVVAGRNVTKVRDARTIIESWEDGDPGGDAGAVLHFPALTPWDEFGTGALSWLYDNATVEILRVDADGVVADGDPVFQGNVGPLGESVVDSAGEITIACPGVWEALDQRITKPRATSSLIDTGRLVAKFVNDEIDYGFPARRMAVVETGVLTGERGSFGEPLASGTLTDVISQVDTVGEEWTVKLAANRRLYVARRDTSGVDASLWFGQVGLRVNLSLDGSVAFTNIYGMGQDGPRAWRNYKYPNAPIDAPPYPLPDGVFFDPGDGETGFSPFSEQLTTRGYPLDSGDTYLAVDEPIIRDFQNDTGIQVDGIVGGQTWNQAFQTGANAHALDNAYPAPIAQVRATDPFTYDGRGARTGNFAGYNRRLARREKLVQFGMLSKALATKSAKHEIARSSTPGWAGTLTLTNIDPPEMCALDLRSHMNVLLQGHHGEDRVLHVARTHKDPGMRGDRVVTLTVDEHARPLQELWQIVQRNRGIADIAGRRAASRRGAARVPDTIPFDSESGAGLLKPASQTAGLWNRYEIPLGETTDIVRVRLVATQDTQIAAALFDRPVTSNALAALPGMSNPSVGSDPWAANRAALLAMGLKWATGSPGGMQGYWPNDPGGALTGVLDDSGPAVTFVAQIPPWGFLMVWTSLTCHISGDPAEGYRALYPAPAQ